MIMAISRPSSPAPAPRTRGRHIRRSSYRPPPVEFGPKNSTQLTVPMLPDEPVEIAGRRIISAQAWLDREAERIRAAGRSASVCAAPSGRIALFVLRS